MSHPTRAAMLRRAQQREALAMMAAATLGLVAISAGEAVGLNTANRTLHNPAWQLVAIDRHGEAYVLDHGLTLGDCRSSDLGAEYPATLCERER